MKRGGKSVKVILYTHSQKDPGLATAEKIAELAAEASKLNKQGEKIRVLFDSKLFSTFELDSKRKETLCSKFELCDMAGEITDADLILCIGGDGTILRGAKLACASDVPVLGVNSGRIGYLAELEMDGLDNLVEIFCAKEAQSFEPRMLLDVTVERNGKIVFSELAFNEAAVTKGAVSRMIDLEITSVGKSICKYRADGVIISTPTGSTAYAMSAGGPIIDPAINCILVVPVCPYLAVNSSPVIYSPESVLEVVFSDCKGNSAFVTVDGEQSFELVKGDKVCVKRSSKTVKMLKLRNIDFCSLLNMKLSCKVAQRPE